PRTDDVANARIIPSPETSGTPAAGGRSIARKRAFLAVDFRRFSVRLAADGESVHEDRLAHTSMLSSRATWLVRGSALLLVLSYAPAHPRADRLPQAGAAPAKAH